VYVSQHPVNELAPLWHGCAQPCPHPCYRTKSDTITTSSSAHRHISPKQHGPLQQLWATSVATLYTPHSLCTTTTIHGLLVCQVGSAKQKCRFAEGTWPAGAPALRQLGTRPLRPTGKAGPAVTAAVGCVRRSQEGQSLGCHTCDSCGLR
jgi:hypothetical protein